MIINKSDLSNLIFFFEIKNNKIFINTTISIIAGPAAKAKGKRDNKIIFKFSIFFKDTIRF